MIEDIWVMEEECCSKCGALLHPLFEGVLCTDCLHDAWYAEDQEREAAWFDEEDEQPTIGTPEEAHAVALSLTDEDVERIEAEEQRMT
jgi:hypothetical protein